MQDNLVYEYAVIRFVPRVEREEFINVGVILYCGKKKFLKCHIHPDEAKLRAIAPSFDLDELAMHLKSFENICNGSAAGGVIGALDLPSRFRWLTATRSTILQTSKVHPGLCVDPDQVLDLLFSTFVL